MNKKTNILIALTNLSSVHEGLISPFYNNENRINSQGESLEYFIKDIFCNTLQIEDKDDKDFEHQKYLSYIGNQRNPPDFIVTKGVAVEVKKIKTPNRAIALNSSYPKSILKASDSRITQACKDCETSLGGWQEKDIIYFIGTVKTITINKKKEFVLKHLWAVYGDCYAASEVHYLEPFSQIKGHIKSIGESLGGLEETNEIGKFKRVDPLGITSLRVRGMWNIDNPNKVFSYLTKGENKFSVNVLLRRQKFNRLWDEASPSLKASLESDYQLNYVKIKDPNNPAKNIEAIFIQGIL